MYTIYLKLSRCLEIYFHVGILQIIQSLFVVLLFIWKERLY